MLFYANETLNIKDVCKDGKEDGKEEVTICKQEAMGLCPVQISAFSFGTNSYLSTACAENTNLRWTADGLYCIGSN